MGWVFFAPGGVAPLPTRKSRGGKARSPPQPLDGAARYQTDAPVTASEAIARRPSLAMIDAEAKRLTAPPTFSTPPIGPFSDRVAPIGASTLRRPEFQSP